MMNNKKLRPSSVSSEHWLTVCACAVCGKTPDISPIFKCSMGHPHCFSCFQKIVRNGLPVCGMCESKNFTRQDVSADFLHKLKNKPGIGRHRRYPIDSGKGMSHNIVEKPAVTVEQLFKMPSSKIEELFNAKTTEKLRGKKLSETQTSLERHMKQSHLKSGIGDEEACGVDTLADNSSKICFRKPYAENSRSLSTDNIAPIMSKRPLKCPHDHCNKIIAVSAFQAHFDYEHGEFQRHSVERGKDLELVFDSAIIEHGCSLCLAILKVLDTDTFWLMVSGSENHRPTHDFAIFWLLASNDKKCRCSIKLAAHHEEMTCSVFCGTNGIHESQTIPDVTSRCNCLYITRQTLKTMLCYGSSMKLTIRIH